jgi:hypothetical protein
MNVQESSYYAEIQILVDGWPWNLSEFDFRRWFAPGSCPRALDAAGIADESPAATRSAPLSENRRVARRRKRRDRRRQAA